MPRDVGTPGRTPPSDTPRDKTDQEPGLAGTRTATRERMAEAASSGLASIMMLRTRAELPGDHGGIRCAPEGLDVSECAEGAEPSVCDQHGKLSPRSPTSSPQVTYTVLTSTDLQTWETSGVALSDIDAEGYRTAILVPTAPRRFMMVIMQD